MSQPNGHGTHHPDPTQELLRRSPRSTITLLLVALSGGGVGGYSAARVEQSTHQQRRALRPAADECGGCSPPCTKTQTCYRCTCVDVATSHHLRLRDLEERVQQLAGEAAPLSAGAVR